MKKCTKCGQEYPATLFYFHRNQYLKDGFTNRCINCLDNRFKGFSDETPIRFGSAANITNEESARIEQIAAKMHKDLYFKVEEKDWSELKKYI